MSKPTFTEASFTSTTTGTAVRCTKALVVVSGTFSATVKLKWNDAGGTEHTVQENGSDLSFTAAGERVVDFGVPVEVFWECTSYSSGTAVCSISGSTVSYY